MAKKSKSEPKKKPATAPSETLNTPAAGGTKKLELNTSRHFVAWMAEQKVSLAFTTYQAGKLFLLGVQPDGKLSVFERTFNRCMGLWGDGQTLWMSTLYQMWRFENVLPRGQISDGYDKIYVPQIGYTTGDLDIHDIGIDKNGKPIFVATLFGCLATLDEAHSFRPLWRPPFISTLAAEDRCHLNGLAMLDGEPKYVSAVSKTNIVDGWREHRMGGGVIIDVAQNAIVADGLSMPHSPRLYRDRLYILQSGTGEFGFIDPASGKFEAICFCPGYLRGLTLIGDFAVIGLSKSRGNKTFTGLALDDALKQHDVEARCGLMVVDLKTGSIVHWLRIEGVVEELYDVVSLPQTARPSAIGFKTDEICRIITIAPDPA